MWPTSHFCVKYLIGLKTSNNQTVMKNIVYPILEMMLQYNHSPFIGEHCMRIAYSFSVTTFQIHKVWGMLSEKKYFIISLGRMYIFS